MEFPISAVAVRRLRTLAGLSRDELAIKASVRRETVRLIETGATTHPRAKTVRAIAKALKVDIAELYETEVAA
jgi:DNA-binding XRE family transcriptional regulator